MNTDNLNLTRRVVVGVQFLFVAFGATVLVPLLVVSTQQQRYLQQV